MVLLFTSVRMWSELLCFVQTQKKITWAFTGLVTKPYPVIVTAGGQESSYKEPEMASVLQWTHFILFK